jgi:hypothetical protein
MNLRRKILKTGLAVSVLSVLKTGSSLASSNENIANGSLKQHKKTVDHFMWAAADLESASAEFERLTGVRPAFGGKHPGFGTQNALVSLNNRTYMEVLALDPQQTPEHFIAREIALLESPAILAFHIERSDLEGAAAIFSEMNIKYSGPFDLSRQRPDGSTLRWRVLIPESAVFQHALPIFIDWMEAPHPSETAPGGCELTHFEVGHPMTTELRSLYQKLDVNLPVVEAKIAYAKATLDTPKGEVILHGLL